MRQDLTKYTKIVLQKRIRPTVGGWGWPNDYATSKVSSGHLWWLITRCLGGVEAGQNVDYIILEWSLRAVDSFLDEIMLQMEHFTTFP